MAVSSPDEAVEVVRTRRRGGRALDGSRDSAFRQAALELLAEVGYERLTMEAVASRTRAAKTTIYRRWQTKAELVADALGSLKGEHDVPDTGSLREDLHALAADIVKPRNDFTALTVGLLNALSHDAELRRVFQEKFFTPRTAVFRVLFERAVDRGEMSEGRDLGLLARLFSALGLQHLVTSGELPDADWARHVIDEVVYPLAMREADGSSASPKTTHEGKPE